MGTRSLTVVRNQYGEENACMARQFDGYPQGHGLELLAFLGDTPVVNGISGHGRVFNGMDDLAAQMVAWFKHGQTDSTFDFTRGIRHYCKTPRGGTPGGFYLMPSGTRGCDEEFLYEIELDALDRPAKVSVTPSYDLYAPRKFREGEDDADAELIVPAGSKTDLRVLMATHWADEIARRKALPAPEVPTPLQDLLAWVDLRIEAEVTNRPDQNVHKATLSGTWNQIRSEIVRRMQP